jgi:hypothetical protein
VIGLATGVMDLANNFIDTFFESREEKREARLKLMELQQAGRLKEIEIGMSAIIAEANSSDPYTSRARPSFLYVTYIIILSAIPSAILSVFFPVEVGVAITNFGKFLNAIPEWLYGLFAVGYLGYSHYRSGDKRTMVENFREWKK